MSKVKAVRVDIKTSDIKYAGTDSNIYLLIGWKTGGVTVRLPDQPGNDNVQGQSTSYKFAIHLPEDLEQIVSLSLVNGMNKEHPGWHVESVNIEAVTDDNSSWKLCAVQLGRWLDTKESTGNGVVLPLKDPFIELGPPSWTPTATIS